MAFRWPEAVLIHGPDTVAGYAPRIETFDVNGPMGASPDLVSWQEGGHRRYRGVQKVRHNELDLFEFEDVDGTDYALQELTLELYEEHVRPVTMGKPSFPTLEAMLEAMRREW